MAKQTIGRLAIFVVLAWMAVMFQFSTQLWNSANTKAILEMVLSAPLVPDFAISLDSLNFGVRKAAHFTEYAVLAGAAYGAAALGFQRPRAQSLQMALACTILFAISDEWHQRFVPGRTSTPQDVGIDILGASVMVVAVALWQWQKPASKNSTAEDYRLNDR
ncbi:MAG: VanZ family protein [Cyanobacteria bacterium P01_A01_bin.17]